MASSKRTIVLCIDRDNDIGQKTGFRGPIIGEKRALEVANALIISDPEESDANTIFAAVKAKREIKGSEIAVLTGDKEVGIKSDEKIVSQLNHVIKKTRPKDAVIVTDGAEDEYIIPIIQSLIPILSIKRVVIRQSERLESSYYVIKEFLHEIVSEPKISRVVLGIPALTLLILAIFGETGWRVVLGAVGFYLLVRGLQLENLILRIIQEFLIALRRGRITFFLYIVSLIFIMIGISYGYNRAVLFGMDNLLIASIAFINGSIFFFFAASLFIWIGKISLTAATVSSEKRTRDFLLRYVTILSLLFAIAIVSFTATEFLIKPGIGIAKLIFSIILGFFAIIISLVVERSQRRK